MDRRGWVYHVLRGIGNGARDIEQKLSLVSVVCLLILLKPTRGQITPNVSGHPLPTGITVLSHLGLPLDSLPRRDSSVSEKCRAESELVRAGADKLQIWALKILDASAKVPAGILSGNLNQLGDFDLCMSAKSDEGTQVRGTYCLVDVDVTFTGAMKEVDDRIHAYRFMTSNMSDIGQRLPKIGQWRWGVCVPSGCTADDVTYTTRQHIINGLQNYATVKVSTDPNMCYTNDGQGYSAGFYVTVVIFGLLATTIALGTVMQEFRPNAETNAERIVQCFSLQNNWKELVCVDQTRDDIPVVHGGRFMNAIALLLSHKKMAMLFNPFSNAVNVSEKMDSEMTMIGRAAILYTDSFLLISGLLTAYSMTKTLDRDRRFNFPRLMINRYMRFTPNLLFLILACTYLTEMLGPGPMWGLVVTKYSQLCKANMWRNMLYIHNLFGFEDMCLTNTHQLGIDMQLYLVSPFLLYVLWRRPRLGVFLLTAIAVVSTYLRYTVALTEELSPVIHYGVSVNRLFRTAKLSYTLPTHRATVYILGLLVGYGARRGLQNLKISETAARIGWSAAALAVYLSVFGPSHMSRRGYVYDATEAANYNAFAPLLWCGFIVWTAIAGWNNRGGWVQDILSWKYFSIFSRISYAFYLVQFPVFFYYVGMQRTNLHYTGILSLFDLKEFAIVTSLAVALTLAVDLPFQNVRKLNLSAGPIKKSQPVNNNETNITDAYKITNHG